MALNFLHEYFVHIFEGVVGRRVHRVRCRILRDASNPFEMAETQFMKLYRVPPVIVLDLLIPEIQPFMRQSIRQTYIPVHIRILITLHFLAQGSYQTCVGADKYLAVAQSTVSKIISEVIEIIATRLFRNYVHFPTNDEDVSNVMRGFQIKFGFPRVRGAIDCTHIAILSPPIDDPAQPALAYYNRKGYYSLNVQSICDSNLKILAINARFPGATHDAAIWATSTISRYMRRRYEEGDVSWLLGDSGYPLTPFLMTPITGVDPGNGTPEQRYNRCHIRARNTIERCFGVLKQRFRCLLKHRVLHYSHRKAGLIVYACTVLHNILVNRGIDPDEEVVDEEEDDDENLNHDDPPPVVDADMLAAGRLARNRLIRNNF